MVQELSWTQDHSITSFYGIFAKYNVNLALWTALMETGAIGVIWGRKKPIFYESKGRGEGREGFVTPVMVSWSEAQSIFTMLLILCLGKEKMTPNKKYSEPSKTGLPPFMVNLIDECSYWLFKHDRNAILSFHKATNWMKWMWAMKNIILVWLAESFHISIIKNVPDVMHGKVYSSWKTYRTLNELRADRKNVWKRLTPKHLQMIYISILSRIYVVSDARIDSAEDVVRGGAGTKYYVSQDLAGVK